MTKNDILYGFAKAAFKRKTRMGKVNVIIDGFAEKNPILDECLHFLNEAVIHGKPKTHIRNTIKYGGHTRILNQVLRHIKN